MPNADAIADLLDIMRDENVTPRDRLNAAVSASRVSPLAMPGEPTPPAVTYLRIVIDDQDTPTNHKREAAAALAYYQRRAKKAELMYNVADQDDKREAWRRVLNAAIRYHCAPNKRQYIHLLLAPTDAFITPPCDPELALAALLGGNQQQKRAPTKRAIDERTAPATWAGSEPDRRKIVASVAQAVHARIYPQKSA